MTLTHKQWTQASYLQKNQMLQNVFFYIFNAEIAQFRQKLEVILGTKVVPVIKKMYFTKNVVPNSYYSMKTFLERFVGCILKNILEFH